MPGGPTEPRTGSRAAEGTYRRTCRATSLNSGCCAPNPWKTRDGPRLVFQGAEMSTQFRRLRSVHNAREDDGRNANLATPQPRWKSTASAATTWAATTSTPPRIKLIITWFELINSERMVRRILHGSPRGLPFQNTIYSRMERPNRPFRIRYCDRARAAGDAKSSASLPRIRVPVGPFDQVTTIS